MWSWPDLLPASIMLSLYQASPGRPHFVALKDLVKYLCHHIDTPLVYRRTKQPSIPRGLCRHTSPFATVATTFVYTSDDSGPGETTLPSGPIGPIDHAFVASIKKALPKKDATPPHSESFANAGCHMDGTVVHYICRRQATMAENSTSHC
jgi:hypothetical protein